MDWKAWVGGRNTGGDRVQSVTGAEDEVIGRRKRSRLGQGVAGWSTRTETTRNSDLTQ